MINKSLTIIIVKIELLNYVHIIVGFFYYTKKLFTQEIFKKMK